MPFSAERMPAEHQDLFGVRTDTPYTPAERAYSSAVQIRVEELLAGRCSELVLLRRYHRHRDQISVMPAPPGIDHGQLRLTMVERILVGTIAFLRDVSPGGPIFQRMTRSHLVETQQFSTKYPHILIERLDAFDRETRDPAFTEWRIRRTQNQRAETQLNRWLDAANLALSAYKTIKGEK